MLNATQIIKEIPKEKIKDTSAIILKSSIKTFIEHPFISGGVFIIVVLLVGFLYSFLMDKLEGIEQQRVWDYTIYIILFVGVLLGLIFLDTSETLIWAKISDKISWFS